MTVRTRFAPSPTGYLHIGGARTALYSWLHARSRGGTFILRIEDTDLERSTPESVTAILEGMNWLGLDYDEGPFFQTQRFPRYKEVIARMLEEGSAYRCYCSKERLDVLRAEQMARKEKPRYDQRCRNGVNPVPSIAPVVRFRNPNSGQVIVDDMIRGRVTIQNSELDDLIIARSDGVPTYNFTVVVDDMDMRITHVIRGDDHLNNTPRQMNLFAALGTPPPTYAHVPMILGPDGTRLSKRHGAVSVLQYRDDGYMAEALLNYLLRLGWSHGDQEIFSMEEMVRLFEVAKVRSSAAAFDPQKLLWLNQHYMKTGPIERVTEQLRWQLQRIGIDVSNGPDLGAVVLAQRERAKTLAEMAQNSVFFYREPDSFEPKAAAKYLREEVAPVLESLNHTLAQLADWTSPGLHAVLDQTAKEHGLSFGDLAQPLRLALTGRPVSPPIDVTLALVGRERCLKRIAIAVLRARGEVRS